MAARPTEGNSGCPAITILPNHHVTAAQILKVIGEGAKRANNGVRISARLVFDTLAFDRALAQELIEVDGQFVRHR